MPLSIDRFVALRPMLYHLTARSNVDEIVARGELLSAAVLLELAGRAEEIRRRRREHLPVKLNGSVVSLRDQAPLHRGNVHFEGDWAFEDLVECLNRRVFFWPGTAAGPSDYGLRHFQRYRAEDAVVLILPAALLLKTEQPQPEFCRYNSGSPRCTQGRGSPRGPSTFQTAAEFSGTPASVVEVTYPGRARLPVKTMQIVSVKHFG